MGLNLFRASASVIPLSARLNSLRVKRSCETRGCVDIFSSVLFLCRGIYNECLGFLRPNAAVGWSVVSGQHGQGHLDRPDAG